MPISSIVLVVLALAHAATPVSVTLDTGFGESGQDSAAAKRLLASEGRLPKIVSYPSVVNADDVIFPKLSPSTSLLVLFRHGQAQHNNNDDFEEIYKKMKAHSKDGVVNLDQVPGRLRFYDSALTETGERQASELADEMSHKGWSKVLERAKERPDVVKVVYLTSPLKRAMQTAAIVAPNVQWIVHEDIRERLTTLGSDLRENLSVGVTSNFLTQIGRYESGEVTKCTQFGIESCEDPYRNSNRGETPTTLNLRVERLLDTLLVHQKAANTATIYVVSSHGAMIGAILKHVGWHNDYRLHNCEMIPILLRPE